MMVAGDDEGGGGGGGKMSKSEKDQVGWRGPSLSFLRGCLFFTFLHRKSAVRGGSLKSNSTCSPAGKSFSAARPSHGRDAVRLLQQLLLRFASLTVAVHGTLPSSQPTVRHRGVTAEFACGTDPRSTALLVGRGLLVRHTTEQWWTATGSTYYAANAEYSLPCVLQRE